MSNTVLSIVLGIVEGLTEFLPVSSTAHLRLTEQVLGVDLSSGYWKMYSVVIQLGAILSVVWLFWRRALQLWGTFPRGDRGDRNLLTHPLSLIMISFAITAGPCYLADKKIGNNLENLTVMACALLFGGILMWVVDAVWGRGAKVVKAPLEAILESKGVTSAPKVPDVDCPKSGERKEGIEVIGTAQAIWIGLAQILSAVFPGTSRSMVTIAAGQVAGLSRPTALEFSFFLSIPTMFAATGYKLLQAVLKRPKTAAEIAAYGAPDHQWVILAIGFVVSFLVALIVNAWFLGWVRKRGFTPFAIYRIVLGAGLLAWLWLGAAK